MPKLRASQTEFIVLGLGEVIDLNKTGDDSFQILFHMTTQNLVSLGLCSVSCFFMFKLTDSMSSQKFRGASFTVFCGYKIHKASLICPQFVEKRKRSLSKKLRFSVQIFKTARVSNKAEKPRVPPSAQPLISLVMFTGQRASWWDDIDHSGQVTCLKTGKK